MCICSVNTVYLQCGTLADVPVVGVLSDACVCLCLGFCTVSSAEGKTVYVGWVVCVFVCVCRFLSAFDLMALKDLLDPQLIHLSTQGEHLHGLFAHTHTTYSLFLDPSRDCM